MMDLNLSDKDLESLQDILIETLGVARDQLRPEADLQRDLGADSLTMIEIGMAVEERFHLSIPDERLEPVATVGDVYELAASLLSQ